MTSPSHIAQRPTPQRHIDRRGPSPLLVGLTAFLVGAGLTFASMTMLGQDETAPPTTDQTTIPGGDAAYAEESPANWDVVGLPTDAVLPVYAGPGRNAQPTASLAASTVGLESTGRIAISGETLWREIVVPGAATGWVDAWHLTETRPPAPDADLGIPAPALAMVESIRDGVEARDLETLATLAFAGDSPFTASFGVEVTNPSELVALWQQIGEDEVFSAITALVSLPDWYETAGQDTDGNVVAIFVTPRFMHEPSNAENRRLVEEAFGFEYVESAVADGQYLGWRLGITAEGDWMFLVSGD